MEPVTSEKYQSAAPLSPGQVRAIDKSSDCMIPTDIPSGIAQWLVDGGLAAAVDAAIEEARLEWLKAHSGLELRCSYGLGDIEATSLYWYMRERRRPNKIRLECPASWMDLSLPGGKGFQPYFYEVKKGLGLDMYRHLVNREKWKGFAIDPLCAVNLLDSGFLESFRSRRIMLFSDSKDGEPNFLRVKSMEKNDWNLCHKGPDQYPTDFMPGVYVGFMKPIF